jgi:hypothetical protein
MKAKTASQRSDRRRGTSVAAGCAGAGGGPSESDKGGGAVFIDAMVVLLPRSWADRSAIARLFFTQAHG